MDRGEVKETIVEWIKKYRSAALILAVGLLLMCVPNDSKDQRINDIPEIVKQEVTLQQELETLLAGLEGAGKVRVLLSISSGAQSFYQMDEDLSRSDGTLDQRKETVVITSSDRNESGLLQRVDPPSYQGAVVLCQGADRATVRFAVVEAVATATGLRSDKISVLKMK